MKLILLSILLLSSCPFVIAQNSILSTKSPKNSSNINTKQTSLPESFPLMQHTGKVSQDIQKYNTRKQSWINAHPEEYNKITATPIGSNAKAKKEREQKIKSRKKNK